MSEERLPKPGNTVIVAAGGEQHYGSNGDVLIVLSDEIIVINPTTGEISWPTKFCSANDGGDANFSEIQMELCPVRYTDEEEVLLKISDHLAKPILVVDEIE